MTLAALLALVWQNIRRARRQALLSVIGITIGVASLTFFLGLSAGVRRVVLGRIFHVERIEIEPPRSTIDLPLLGGGPRLIDDAQVERLRQVPGVKRAAPRMRLSFPSKAWGGAEYFGGNRYLEIVGDGLDPAAVAGEDLGPLPFADLEAGPRDPCGSDADCKKPREYCAWDVHQCLAPVPLIISPTLVEIYNTTVAPSHGLPKITNFILSRFRGFTFTAELGTSFLGGQGRGLPRQRKVMLVGVSDRAIGLGVSLPLPYVRRWNAEYGGPSTAAGYTSVTVEVADKAAITRVAAAARDLGLTVASSGAEQAGLAITLLTLLFGLVSLAIVAVAMINIVHTFYRTVTERRREIGVLRALGASAADVRRLLLGEAAAIGLGGGLLGAGSAWAASLLVDLAARRWVPDFPFKPDSFFAFSPSLLGGILLFSVAVCVAGALLPARAASRLEPAAALTAN